METDNYITTLQQLLRDGALILEAIAPDAFNDLVKQGSVLENDYERYLEDAGRYVQEYHRRFPKTLSECIAERVWDQADRSRREQLAKMNIAKKLAVYDFIRQLERNEDTIGIENK